MQLSPQTLKVSIVSFVCALRDERMMLMVDILKAARIVFSFEHHDKRGTGAYELDGAMIDAPVYKQVCPFYTLKFKRRTERKADDRH
jgi:hypothetical protein